jgi:hypothetical protein
MLVPAEMATQKAEPKQAKAKPVTLAGKVPPDMAEQFRDVASEAGSTVNAMIVKFIADTVATRARLKREHAATA